MSVDTLPGRLCWTGDTTHAEGPLMSRTVGTWRSLPARGVPGGRGRSKEIRGRDRPVHLSQNFGRRQHQARRHNGASSPQILITKKKKKAETSGAGRPGRKGEEPERTISSGKGSAARGGIIHHIPFVLFQGKEKGGAGVGEGERDAVLAAILGVHVMPRGTGLGRQSLERSFFSPSVGGLEVGEDHPLSRVELFDGHMQLLDLGAPERGHQYLIRP